MPYANLYIVKDDMRKVDKNLNNVVKQEVQITYKDDTEFIVPSIILQNDNELLKKVNYVYLSDKKRYYYVDGSPIELVGNRIQFNLLEDVLMSHSALIKSLECTVTRNEDLLKCNGYLPDNNYKVYSYETLTCKLFPYEMKNNSIILMTVG